MPQIPTGTKIRFRTANKWANHNTTVRVVNGKLGNHLLVKYNGWANYAVHPDEVVGVVSTSKPTRRRRITHSRLTLPLPGYITR